MKGPLGNAKILIMRKKKKTPQTPFHILSSVVVSSLKNGNKIEIANTHVTATTNRKRLLGQHNTPKLFLHGDIT